MNTLYKQVEFFTVKNCRRLIMLLGTLLFVGLGSVSATDYYFNSNGNWSDLNNWRTACGGSTKPAALPTAADNVYICNDVKVIVDVNAVCKDLTMQNNSPGLTINAGVTLDIKGDFKSFKDTDGDGVVVRGTLLVGGNVTYGRNNGKEFKIESTGSVTVNGNFTVAKDANNNATDAVLTVDGYLYVKGNFSDNHNNDKGLRGSGTLKVDGNFTYKTNNSVGDCTNLTLDMSGACGRTMNIQLQNSDLTVKKLIQPKSPCTSKMTITVSNKKFTVTTYDQNCNSENLKPTTITVTNPVTNAACNPEVRLTASLSQFTSCTNEASAAQKLTLNAQLITAPAVVGPVSGYQFSLDGTTWLNSVSQAPNASGEIVNTTVWVRVATGQSTGTLNANLTASSGATTSSTVALSAQIGAGAQLVASPAALNNFTGYSTHDYSVPQTFVVSGACLGPKVKVTVGGDYEISTKPNGPWSTSLDVEPGTTVYVQIREKSTPAEKAGNGKPTSVAANKITLTANGKTAEVTLGGGTRTACSAQTFYSIVSTGNWTDNTTWSFSELGSPVPAGTYPGPCDIVKIGYRDDGRAESKITVDKDITCGQLIVDRSGSVTLSGTNTLRVLGEVKVGTTSDNGNTPTIAVGNGTLIVEGKFTIRAGKGKLSWAGTENDESVILNGNMEITRRDDTDPFESGNGWFVFNGSTITIATNFNSNKSFTIKNWRQSGSGSTRYTVTSSGNVSDKKGYFNITKYDQSCNPTNFRPTDNRGFVVATVVNADCSVPKITVMRSIPAYSICQGATETPKYDFSVKGDNLTAPIVIPASAPYQYSLNGTTWSTTLTLQPNNGTVAETLVYVRIDKTQVTTTDDIVARQVPITSTGATDQSLSIAEVSVGKSEITITPELVEFDPVCDGIGYGRKAINIQGTCVENISSISPQSGYKFYAAATGGLALATTNTASTFYTTINNAITATKNLNITIYAARDARTTFSNENALSLSWGGNNMYTIQASGTASTNLTGSTTQKLIFNKVCAGNDFTDLQPFTVKGSCVAAAGVIVAVAPEFELYNAAGTKLTAPYTVAKAAAETGTTLYLKRIVSSEFDTPNAITLTNGSTINTIAAKGELKNKQLYSSSNSVSLSYLIGGTAPQTCFDILTECWSNSIAVTLEGADANNFEITSTTTLGSGGGQVCVKMKSGLPTGAYSAQIKLVSDNTTLSVSVTGNVVAQKRDVVYKGCNSDPSKRDWTVKDNWYLGNCNSTTKLNDVPTAYDNVTLCTGSCPIINSEVVRIGDFTIAESAGKDPVKLTISGTLDIRHDFTFKSGQITVESSGRLDVTGNFTVGRYLGNDQWDAGCEETKIDNKGTINITDGKFEMDGGGNSNRLNSSVYFSNKGSFNLTNSDFIIGAREGAFFYNESKGTVFINNPLGSTHRVEILAHVGLDDNCFRTTDVYTDNCGGGNCGTGDCGGNKDLQGTVKTEQFTCDTQEKDMRESMDAQIALSHGTTKTTQQHSYCFFNSESLFVVNNSDMLFSTTNSSRTHTIKGKIYVRDGDFIATLTQGGGMRFRIKNGGGVYAYNQFVPTKGNLNLNGAGGGAQFSVENGGEMFSRGFISSSCGGGGGNAFAVENGGVAFIGDMAASVTNQFKIHVASGATLYYCGNMQHPVGDKVGYVYGTGRLLYANDFYGGRADGQPGEDNPLVPINGWQDFYLQKGTGAVADSVAKIRWETTAACQAEFDQRVTPPGSFFLPVELIEFTAEREGTHVNLNWATQSETNNDYFTVQRSADGVAFYNVCEDVLGAGTTTVPQYYGITDYAPLAGLSYYRLSQTDFNGAVSYSRVVSVLFGEGAGKAFEITYAVSKGSTTIDCSFANATQSNYVSIHAITGTLLYETTVAAGNPTYSIHLPLPSGVYLVSNVNNGVKTVAKMLVNNR
ncbi:MAG: T9SS type A sorting domain-containing protein [Bacteroidales bacterium]|jgi:hypothetical protein|nr:T9SS type A sorting domain-containing protein [Bacteroidales bacterium]